MEPPTHLAEPTETGWEQSARAWISFVDRGDRNREMLLDPAMLTAIGNVSGLSVCDVGCGEGRFCRMLSRLGATTVGVDATSTMVAEARLRDPGGAYEIAPGHRLPFENEQFDLVVNYVSLIDIENFRECIHEMARILKPGGRIAIANLNGFITAGADGWRRNEAGERDHYGFDRYLEERPEAVEWAEIRVVNWHRPMQSYLQAFLATGLRLCHFEEPGYTDAQVALDPTLEFQNRAPFFHTMVWKKD